ncbi:hypothetical protein [Saccharothrix syringae]|uniref:Uncharacterized protein n=1 Tax=Saccharothrix syringae TaxID=103733 RepID=A0A5Q0H2S3_SACSY|nr:hypothetical protein [Saccharothrix syringae]QFZ20516.1 hypothetical protein EKG83_26690 [Saccharothrix syringae]
MPTTVPELRDVVGFVLEHADKNALDHITQAVKSRHDVLREKAAAEITENATVTIRGISPKYLNGLSDVVKEIIRGRGKPHATVTLDKASTDTLAFSSTKFGHLAGRTSYDLTGVPLSCCEVVKS